MIELDAIIYTIRFFFINIFTYCLFLKMINVQLNIKAIKTVIIIIASIILAVMCSVIKFKIDPSITMPILYVSYSILFAIMTKNKMGYSMIVSLLAFAISYILYLAAMTIAYIPSTIFKVNNDFIILLGIIVPIYIGFIYLFFKIKRFKNGFLFLQNKIRNDYIDVFVLSISTIILFIYLGLQIASDVATKYVFVQIIVGLIVMVLVIQKTFTMIYKQKQMEKTIEEQQKEIEEKNKEIERISSEKLNFMKISHQFYNRQEALELKVKELINNKNLNTEISEELGAVDRINSISKEYAKSMQKLRHNKKLPTTNVEGIDDIFKYMQSECEKYEIDFNLQLNGSINYMVNNIVPQDRLETLIGDHIRDSIIAINSNSNDNKTIIAKLESINNYYEFSVYDTGVEFEIDTLIKLGLEPVTTHKDDGGSGLGFITTFELLKEYNASLVIEEKKISSADYTKAVRIIFDNKNEYKIRSYRADEIKEKDKENRIIIEKM